MLVKTNVVSFIFIYEEVTLNKHVCSGPELVQEWIPVRI